MKNPYIHIFIVFLLVSFYFPKMFVQLFYFMSVEEVSFNEFAKNNPSLLFYGNFFAKTITLLLPVYLIKIKLLSFRRPVVELKDLLYMLYTFLAKIPIGLFVMFVGYLFKIELQQANNQILLEKYMFDHIFLMFIMVVILAPIIEEFFFRKVIIHHFFRNKPFLGLVISSLFFGLIHMMSGFSLLPFISYSLVGLVLGILYIKTGRIESSIIAHSFGNLFALLIIVL